LSHKIFLTGPPGVGKSSVLLRLVEALENRGFQVGGMVTREARDGGVRIGFNVTDVLTGREGWLATAREPIGPRVGKYSVDLEGLEGIGVQAITSALQDPKTEVVVIDEVGPMELLSAAFKRAVRQGMASTKILIGTIHYRATDPLIWEIKSTREVKIITVTKDNRLALHMRLMKEITSQEDLAEGVPTGRT